MTLPCMSCARIGTSCCKNYQISLTTGDIQRISEVLGHTDFFTFEPPVLEEIEPGYDPNWLSLIMGSQGMVRVLKRTEQRNCALLTKNGCSLPYDCRPLICRLYPYTYTEQGILGIDQACPISQGKDWGPVLDQLDMPENKAKQWLALLYAEVREEIALRHGVA
ncbi:MAG: YkgJ family cysteine cluster protein [Proteobacteria bacterium]|nr:YkgJ family cysteine cluster protein [Pseudomonadota bacterium]